MATTIEKRAAEEQAEAPEAKAPKTDGVQQVLAAYKVYKLYASSVAVRITITDPTPMELYTMIHELNAMSHDKKAFKDLCAKHGASLPDAEALQAMQIDAYGKFTEPATRDYVDE